jgi:hypothetical protein
MEYSAGIDVSLEVSHVCDGLVTVNELGTEPPPT